MITFYSPKNPYGFLSNFSRHPIDYAGERWQTSEHAFQAMKFWPHRPDLVKAVRLTPGPTEAAAMGRDRNNPMRPDWDHPPDTKMSARLTHIEQPQDNLPRPGVQAEPLFARTKDVFMFDICFVKAMQYPEITAALLATKDEVLVEDALHDPYWGWGSSHVGENKLGRVYMAVRQVIARGTQAEQWP